MIPRAAHTAGGMLLTAILALAMILPGTPTDAGIVTLNGYRFSTDVVDSPDIQDSALLSSNRYFSDYARVVDYNAGLYGYGAFRNYDNTQSYRQALPVNGVQCSVILEQGYIPYYSPGDGVTSFTMEFGVKYHYLARDTQDNIHLLQIIIIPDNPSTGIMSWSVDDLPSGVTTLIYPDDPAVGQQVFGGHITDVSGDIGDVTSDALVIEFDDLPYDFPGPVTEYLLPGSAVFAVAHDWDGGTNGFSRDGKAPVRSDEDQKAWEEWWDDHCFISACGD